MITDYLFYFLLNFMNESSNEWPFMNSCGDVIETSNFDILIKIFKKSYKDNYVDATNTY